MKTVVFVGFVRKAQLDYFLEKNYTVGLFRDIHNEDIGELEISEIEQYLDFVFPIDFTDKKKIEQSLKSVYFKSDTLVVCFYDRYLLGTAYIAETLNLNQSSNITPDVARNATNKIFQRREFEKNYPEITPAFKMVKNFHGAYTFTRKHGFPVIIKPAGLSQSQLVNVCNNLEELIVKGSYVFDHIAEVYQENHVYRTPQVLIEQYLTGKQYSVDSYVDFEGKITHTPICQQILGFDVGKNNFETVYSMYSDDIDKKTEKKIYETVEKSIKSLGIKGNPTHIEVRVLPEGECKIIEVNLRPGAMRSDLLPLSFGINHIQNTLNTHLNLPVNVNSKLLKHSACPQFWPDLEGKFISVEGIEEVKKLPSFVSISKLNHSFEDDMVGPADLGYPKIFHLIFAHENKEQLMKDIENARKTVKVNVEPIKKEEEN